jgi:hypothetical protein
MGSIYRGEVAEMKVKSRVEASNQLAVRIQQEFWSFLTYNDSKVL